jgi:hypothetical protein
VCISIIAPLPKSKINKHINKYIYIYFYVYVFLFRNDDLGVVHSLSVDRSQGSVNECQCNTLHHMTWELPMPTSPL